MCRGGNEGLRTLGNIPEVHVTEWWATIRAQIPLPCSVASVFLWLRHSVPSARTQPELGEGPWARGSRAEYGAWLVTFCLSRAHPSATATVRHWVNDFGSLFQIPHLWIGLSHRLKEINHITCLASRKNSNSFRSLSHYHVPGPVWGARYRHHLFQLSHSDTKETYRTSILQEKKLRLMAAKCLVAQNPAASTCQRPKLVPPPLGSPTSVGHAVKKTQGWVRAEPDGWAEGGREAWARLRRPGPSEGKKGSQDWATVMVATVPIPWESSRGTHFYYLFI